MVRDEDRVLELFHAAVSEAGGLRRMVEERRLAWMPALMESACTLVLRAEERRDPAEIADLVGNTRDAVEGILAAPADRVPDAILQAPPAEAAAREQIAGALVRHAYHQAQHPSA